MAQSEGASVAINVLNKVMRYAVTLGVGASVLQTSLYTGAHIVIPYPSSCTQVVVGRPEAEEDRPTC